MSRFALGVPLALCALSHCAPHVNTPRSRGVRASVHRTVIEPEDETGADYVAVFDALVAKIEARHQFAQSVRPKWPEYKTRLRAMFGAVHTRTEALEALAQVQNALGDRHCRMSPPSDQPQELLSLGVRLYTEVRPEGVSVFVDKIFNRQLSADVLREGDRVMAVDGETVDAWLEAHPFESNSLNTDVAMAERVRSIAVARLPWSTVKRGDERVLRVSRDGQTHDVGLRFAPAESFNEDDPSERSLDDAPAMSSVGCRPDEHTLYSDFTLSAVGMNVCVYTPTRGRMDTRLVRFVSFLYDDQAPGDDLRRARADHDLLVRELAGARAVILDLHENHGGNNPYVFLSWFAKRPWDHAQMHVQVSSDLSDHDVRALVWNDPQRFHRYQQAAERGERSLEWPFLCVRNGQTVLDGTCESQGPRESELVTRAPVAVVTGHECTSSCDAFVVNWSAFQMGPLVGRQPAHGFTGMRLSFPLFTPDGRDLGRFSIAYSWEALPRTGAPLEGAPVRLDWEAPRIFQTRHTWVDLSVQEARRRVEAM